MSSSQSKRTLAGKGVGVGGRGYPKTNKGNQGGKEGGSKLWNLELTYFLNVPQ